MVIKVMTGNHAVAEAVRLSRVQVVAAYPITPQTTIVEKISEMIEKGIMNAKILRVESEHSALAAAYAAASAGARAFTATASHGLLYMHEVVWWAAGSRIPLVMAVTMRAIGPPWNIHVDHQDIMDQRDTGWIIGIAQENQEVLDMIIQAYRISEDPRVYLPVIIGLDGFILSHTSAPVDVPSQEEVDMWLPGRRQPYAITPESKIVMGNISNDEDHMMMRYSMHIAMENAKKVISEVDKDYGKAFGRSYGGLIDCYMCDDASYGIIITGSWAGDAKRAVDELRKNGYKVGVIRLRYIRPWPREHLRSIVEGMKGIIVFDRAVSMGSTGVLFSDVMSTIYGLKVSVKGMIAGLAGVDIGWEVFHMYVKNFIEEVEAYGFVYDPIHWILPREHKFNRKITSIKTSGVNI